MMKFFSSSNIRQLFKSQKTIRIIWNMFLRSKYTYQLINEGYKRFKENNGNRGSYNDLVSYAILYCVSFDEYQYQFELWNKTKEDRNEFMSQVKLRLLYNKLLSPEIE